MMDSKLEELQRQVEGGICKLPIVEVEQLPEHMGLESMECKGKSKLAMSRIVRSKVEVEVGKMEGQVEYLTELQNFIVGTGTPPPGQNQTGQNKDESMKAKMEYQLYVNNLRKWWRHAERKWSRLR